MSDPQQQGNAEFRLGNWQKAIDFYSVGIDLSPTSPDSALLYSNRAAAYVQQCQMYRALLDGHSCQRVSPALSKGYLRSAEAFGRLRMYDASLTFYQKAVEFAETSEIRSRYEASRKQAALVWKEHDTTSPEEYSVIAFKKRILKYEKLVPLKSSLKPVDSPNWSSADLYLKAYRGVAIIFLALMRPMTRGLINGVVFTLSDAILTDYGAVSDISRSDANNTTKSPLGVYQQAYASIWTPEIPQLHCDFVADFGALRFLQAAEARRIKEFHGSWELSMPQIEIAIRHFVNMSFIAELMLNWESANAYSQCAIDLVQAGRTLWKFSDWKCVETCGIAFTSGFARAIKSNYSRLMQNAIAAKTKELDGIIAEAGLMSTATNIISSSKENPSPSTDSAFQRLVFHTLPLSQAYVLLAIESESHFSRKSMPDRNAGSYSRNQLACSKAASYYYQAASILPEDDIHRVKYLYSALAKMFTDVFDIFTGNVSELLAGGKTLNYILDKAAEAERAYQTVTAWYGTACNESALKLFVGLICENIMDWLNHNELCCCRDSTRAVDLRCSLNAFDNDLSMRDMFLLGKEDQHLDHKIVKNNGKCNCKNKICSIFHTEV